MPDTYSTDTLLGLIAPLDAVATPLKTLFMREEMVFDTEKVEFDKLDRARRLAPFVSPTVAGKPERSRGFATRDFQPAYLKPKHTVEPSRALKRRPGERFGGSLSAADRFDFAIADNLRLEDEQCTRREEVMVAEALRTGSVVCSGEDFPAMTIDYGRDAALTVALAGGSRWGQVGVSPYASLKTWAVTVAKKSGAHPGTVIMDPLAAALFQADSEVRAVLDNRRQAGGEMQFLSLATGAQGQEMVRIGAIGQFEIWQYSAIYTDDANPVTAESLKRAVEKTKFEAA